MNVLFLRQKKTRKSESKDLPFIEMIMLSKDIKVNKRTKNKNKSKKNKKKVKITKAKTGACDPLPKAKDITIRI